jgi:hypothetical protein
MVGAILMVGVAIFLKNLGAFIDGVDFYVDIRVMGTIVGVIALVGAGLWLRGHQVYAKSKGRTPFSGFALGLLPVVGLVVLAALPARAGGEAATGPPEGEGEASKPEGEQQES